MANTKITEIEKADLEAYAKALSKTSGMSPQDVLDQIYITSHKDPEQLNMYLSAAARTNKKPCVER